MASNNNDHDFINSIKTELDKVGPGFCLAKWFHVSMHLQLGENHSCHHPGAHKIPLEEIKNNPAALHNTKWKKAQRKLMLEGKRPAECSYCWELEDLPGHIFSDRPIKSNMNKTFCRLDEAKNSPWDADVYPNYLELNFSNVCQFKCSYCSPRVSSALFKETEKYGEWPLVSDASAHQYSIEPYKEPGSIYIDEHNNPYIDAFWKWLPECYSYLQVLRVTGGEPLLSSNVFTMLEYIDKHPNPELEFAINSNMGIPHEKLEVFVTTVNQLLSKKHIRTVSLFTSVDTWGPQAEWIRNGLDLDLFEKNVDYYMQNVPGANISFMVTFCLLSIPKFNLLLDKILELRRKYNTDLVFNRVTFDTPRVSYPYHLTALIADDSMINMLSEHLEYMKLFIDDADPNKFCYTEYLKLKRDLDWIINNRYTGEELALHRGDFVRFIDEHDNRRGTDWHAAFPELEYFYTECKASKKS